MSEFIVVVEERKMEAGRVKVMSHGDNFIKLRLAILEDIDILHYLLPIFVLVLILQINMTISVHIIQDRTNLRKTRQHFCH